MKIQLYEAEKINNAKEWPKKYKRKMLEQGLVAYPDVIGENGKPIDNLLLRKETIDQLIPSFIAKPVVIKHQEVNPGNFEDVAVGYISDVYFNSNDGWYYCDFILTHDSAHEKINNGWGVSCAYKVHQIISGGEYHNIPYTGEIVSGTGEHLALVENPRYEDCLMAVNGKNAVLYNEKSYVEKYKPEEDMVKIIGKKDEKKGFSVDSLLELANGVQVKIKDLLALHNKKEETHEIDENTELTLSNGQAVKLADLIKLVNKDTNDGEDKDEDKNEEEEAEGKKRDKSIKNLKNCGCGTKDGKHAENCAMYNEKDEEEKEDKKMENELKVANEKIKALEDKIKATKEAAGNFDSFVKISNARKQVENEDALLLKNGTMHSGSMESGLERGRKYFSK